MYDTIAAISAGGVINQPIGIVRMSGPETLKIIQKIFKGKVGENHQMTYGYIYDGKTLVDEVLIAWFTKKDNFVGDTIIEINTHGGVVVLEQVLELLLKNGARLAERGEFSRRAFLNGKLDLIKADAIHDLIFSQTRKQAKMATQKFSSQTSQFITHLKNDLAYLIGHCAVNIDYSEYTDIEVLNRDTLVPKITLLLEKINQAIKLSEDAKTIYKGVQVAIIGATNVGKSSLLNALLDDDRAIVSSESGTTRDTIEDSFVLEGFLFRLIDTAGIRKSMNKIENLGIERTFKALKKADIVIYLSSPDVQENFEEKEVAQYFKNKVVLKVLNKIDLLTEEALKQEKTKITISASKKDLQKLTSKLLEAVKKVDLDDERILVNARQNALIHEAKSSLENALRAANLNYTVDIVELDLHEAWNALENITGTVDNEKLLDEMFKNFCLGK